jgi:hypothetical protein
MLRERFDRLKLVLAASSFPVGQEFVAVQFSPLSDKRKRAPRQRAGYQLTVEVNRRCSTRIARVEMRPRVRTFIPVHPDRDSIEGADSRHAENLRTLADASRLMG